MEGKKGISEDWLSLWMGLFIVVLGLGMFVGTWICWVWGIKTSIWIDLSKALSPISGTFKGMPGITSLFSDLSFHALCHHDRRGGHGGQRPPFPGGFHARSSG